MPEGVDAKEVAKEIVAATTTTPKKRPGFKTSEFWLAAGAEILGLLLASGAIETGSTWDRIAGLALAGLASMGYSACRGRVKASDKD